VNYQKKVWRNESLNNIQRHSGSLLSTEDLCSLLVGNTDGVAVATGGLGVLATNANAPIVAETTVAADLLQVLKVITKTNIDLLGVPLLVLAVALVAAAVKEPDGDLELLRLGDNLKDALNLLGLELTSTELHVNIGLLANKVGEATANTLNLSKSIHHIGGTSDVRVGNTKNVLEIIGKHKTHRENWFEVREFVSDSKLPTHPVPFLCRIGHFQCCAV